MTEPLSTPAARGTVAGVEAAFRRHIEANYYAKDLIKRIAFDVVPMVRALAPSPEALPASGVDVEQATKMVDDFAKLSVLYATDETPHCPTVKDVCDARAKLIAALTSVPAPEDRT